MQKSTINSLKYELESMNKKMDIVIDENELKEQKND